MERERRPQRFRLDFVSVPLVDKRTGEQRWVSVPDPRRYEFREVNGEESLYDKLEGFYIDLASLREALDRAPELPVYQQQQTLGNSDRYVEERLPAIRAQLDGTESMEPAKSVSDEWLEQLPTGNLGFAILCVDLVGSTKLSQDLPSQLYASIVSTMLYELSRPLPDFHGHVLKYTGDGLIAYFSEPSFILKNDLAVDCAITMHKLIYRAINRALADRGHPKIDVRIGIESGEAALVVVGSPRTKRHRDIIGEVVSIAAKIQSAAQPAEILAGRTCAQNLYLNWRQMCDEIEPQRAIPYKDRDGNPDKLFRVAYQTSSVPRKSA